MMTIDEMRQRIEDLENENWELKCNLNFYKDTVSKLLEEMEKYCEQHNY